MKLESLSLLGLLATLGAAESPQLADYRALCFTGQDSGSTTFGNGVTADYTCRVKVSSDIDPIEEPANSSAECAALCGSGCTSAVWQYTRKRCLLYDSPVTVQAHSRGSIHLHPTGRVVDPGPGPGPGPDASESQCQIEKTACEDDLQLHKDSTDSCKQEKTQLQLLSRTLKGISANARQRPNSRRLLSTLWAAR